MAAHFYDALAILLVPLILWIALFNTGACLAFTISFLCANLAAVEYRSKG